MPGTSGTWTSRGSPGRGPRPGRSPGASGSPRSRSASENGKPVSKEGGACTAGPIRSSSRIRAPEPSASCAGAVRISVPSIASRSCRSRWCRSPPATWWSLRRSSRPDNAWVRSSSRMRKPASVAASARGAAPWARSPCRASTPGRTPLPEDLEDVAAISEERATRSTTPRAWCDSTSSRKRTSSAPRGASMPCRPCAPTWDASRASSPTRSASPVRAPAARSISRATSFTDRPRAPSHGSRCRWTRRAPSSSTRAWPSPTAGCSRHERAVARLAGKPLAGYGSVSLDRAARRRRHEPQPGAHHLREPLPARPPRQSAEEDAALLSHLLAGRDHAGLRARAHRDRNPPAVLLPPFRAPGLPRHEGARVRRRERHVPAQPSSLGGASDGLRGLSPHAARLLPPGVPPAPAIQLGRGRRSPAGDAASFLHRVSAPLGPARALGRLGRDEHGQGSPAHRRADPVSPAGGARRLGERPPALLRPALRRSARRAAASPLRSHLASPQGRRSPGAARGIGRTRRNPMSALPPIHIVESADPLATPRRVALVRPDIRPAVRRREERWVMAFPHLILREAILFQIVVIGLALAAIVFDAPLQGIANPLETPNPAKAPWYFLGLQELLHYFPPVVAGVLMPGLAVVALVVIPYARVNLTAGPLWASRPRRTAVLIGIVTVLLVALFSVFACC